MSNDPMSTVIGVFPDYEQANRAIDALRQTNFSYGRIRLVQGGTGGFFDNLRGMFTGQASITSNTADVLTKMGMPDYEAKHYQQELDANHVLLLMNAEGRPEEAFSVMRQNGAFDINLRLRTTPAEARTEATYADETAARRDTPTDPRVSTAYPDNAPLQSAPMNEYSESRYASREQAADRADAVTEPDLAPATPANEAVQPEQHPVTSSPDVAPPAANPDLEPARYEANTEQETVHNS